ncbi:MAG: hypothetical protein NTY74_10920 [Ignavibacteriae bacterium]|nr:hypothetical protein [Ignavibacteriota bacterium]
MISRRFSEEISVYKDRVLPEPGFCAGYFAIVRFYGLEVPLPDRLCVISKKFKKYETDEWLTENGWKEKVNEVVSIINAQIAIKNFKQ